MVRAFGFVSLLTASISSIAAAAPPAPAASAETAPVVPVRALVDGIRLRHEQFTLANGLRVIVHTDRKAPVVSVGVWYDVGSTDEPADKTGFAHLFEHLMFNGSEHSPGDWFEPLQQIGASALNGSTSYDWTNYYETVPTGALERVLFLESDRMGHLLGAVTQQKVDNQRSVVQNEKRQGDNRPFGLVDYVTIAGLFPPTHPYGHSPIGSMADLDRATLQDVHGWFRSHYGPNNAVLSLAGDIDLPTARTLAERYFGGLAPGPVPRPIDAPVPTLAKRTDLTIHDRVANTRLYRSWAVPGMTHSDSIPLTIGAAVLGGLSSSRLDNVLVRDEKLAVSVSANVQSYARVGTLRVSVDVRPGVDPDMVGRRLDALIAELVREGPTAAEVQRVAISAVGGQVKNLEQSSSVASALASGLLQTGDADHYRRKLERFASARPADVAMAMRRWLRRPVFALTVAPGAREDLAAVTPAPAFARDLPSAADAGRAPMDVARVARAATQRAVAQLPPDAPRTQLPPVGKLAELAFPTVATRRLSNGIEVRYAHRDAVPVTQVMLSFDAGFAADPRDRLGLAMLSASLLKAGTPTLSATQMAQRMEDIGAQIEAQARLDRTVVAMSTLSATLDPSLALLADMVQRPAFAPAEMERLRAEQIAGIAAEEVEARSIANRVAPTLLYGSSHPYGVPGTGSGNRDTVAAITRDDLVRFQERWIQPATARLYVVSSLPIDALMPSLEAALGQWKGRTPRGTKIFSAPIPAARPRIILIDRKDSPQSLIVGAQVLPVRGTDDTLDLRSADAVLGGDFLSRINMDLREDKGWSYGAGSGFGERVDRLLYRVSAPVQADKTGPALAALRNDITTFLTRQGVSEAELTRVTNGNVRELPGAYEGGEAVLEAIARNDLLDRPVDYQMRLPARFRAQTTARLDAAARRSIDPAGFTWIVVGDAATVRPQLDGLGLPVEVMTPIQITAGVRR